MTLKESRSILARSAGHRPSIEVLYRWTRSGARAVNGRRVLLETAKYPAGQVTTRSAIARFLARLNDIQGIARPPMDQDAAERAAERRLSAAGL